MGEGDENSTEQDDRRLQIAKWSALTVAFLTTLAGGSLIGVGVYGLLSPLGASMVPMTLPILAIVTGSSVVLLSLVGCFGSFGQHKNLLWIYFALMAALVFLQFAVAITALGARGDTIDKLANRRWDYLYSNQPRELRRIEWQYQCCGLNFVDDRAWPKTSSDKKRCSNNRDFGFNRPCLGPVRDEWDHRQKIFGVVVTTLAALQLLSLFPVYFLVTSLPSAKEREAELLDEHRRLLEGHRLSGSGASYYSSGRASVPGGVGGVPVQHPVGGPAGSYPYPGTRPGSRSG